MEVPVSEAKARLPDLVRRAETGDEVIITRHGRPVARIVPADKKVDRARRRAGLERVRAAARERGPGEGPSAALSADFLYGEDGLPV